VPPGKQGRGLDLATRRWELSVGDLARPAVLPKPYDGPGSRPDSDPGPVGLEEVMDVPPVEGIVSRSEVLWAARQVIRQHTEASPVAVGTDPVTKAAERQVLRASGRCAQCDGRDPDCRMLVWARTEERAAS
jgi:hypothetical protein